MKLHQQIDEMRRENPHPIDVLIPSFRGMVVAIRNGKGNFKPWIRSFEHADSDEVLEFDRFGTNLYCHATGESLGAIIDIDGASHGALSPEQLAIVEDRRPDCVTASVKSTSGTGRHWFQFWDKPIKATPAEHRLLGKRTAADFKNKVDVEFEFIDVSTNVAWTVALDKGKGGFEGECWPDRRLDPGELPPAPSLPRNPKHGDTTPTMNEHVRRFIELANKVAPQFACYWNAEIGAIDAHKGLLKELQKHYPGMFGTNCPCTDPAEQNCWLRWNEDGYFDVYCWGDSEPTWHDSPGGYKHTTFGKPCEWDEANTGTPESADAYRYENADAAVEVIRRLTGERIEIPDELRTPNRAFDVVRKGNVYQLRAHKAATDEAKPEGWQKGRGFWWLGTKAPDTSRPSNRAAVRQQFRQTVQLKRLTGLFHLKDEKSTPRQVSRIQATSIARHLLGGEDPTSIIDDVTANPVELVCEAFGPVVRPGALNVGPQLTVDPSPGGCPTWLRMLTRLGLSLTPALRMADREWSAWAQANRVHSGGRYLLLWCAWLFQQPRQRMPALAFVGPGRVGKSTFGDSFDLLLDDGGTSDAGEILRKGSQFTGPVATSVIGRIEEIDCSGRTNRNRINTWITAPHLWAEFKGETPFKVLNHLHLIQTCNSPALVPVYDGDSRFVVIEVAPLSKPDPLFTEKLKREAPAFLHLVRSLELPPKFDRLGLPAVGTDAKEQLQESNQSSDERFADECVTVTRSPDDFVSNVDLFARYEMWCRDSKRPPDSPDSQALAKSLSDWFTNRGIVSRRTNRVRGRVGITI